MDAIGKEQFGVLDVSETFPDEVTSESWFGYPNITAQRCRNQNDASEPIV